MNQQTQVRGEKSVEEWGTLLISEKKPAEGLDFQAPSRPLCPLNTPRRKLLSSATVEKSAAVLGGRTQHGFLSCLCKGSGFLELFTSLPGRQAQAPGPCPLTHTLSLSPMMAPTQCKWLCLKEAFTCGQVAFVQASYTRHPESSCGVISDPFSDLFVFLPHFISGQWLPC